MTRINSLKVRFLGDKVLQRRAWKVADMLGRETTFDAEFVALTKLQADVFVTSNRDLVRAVSGLVKTATIDARARPAVQARHECHSNARSYTRRRIGGQADQAEHPLRAL